MFGGDLWGYPVKPTDERIRKCARGNVQGAQGIVHGWKARKNSKELMRSCRAFGSEDVPHCRLGYPIANTNGMATSG